MWCFSGINGLMRFVLLELGFVLLCMHYLQQCWTKMKYVVGTYVVFVFVFLFLYLYLRLYLYFIDLIFSPRPHFWHNLLFFVWILPLQKLLQVPNAQVLLQEVWQWLPWGVQLQVHPLRKRLPLLLWPLQVSVIILCYSGWHLVIRLSVCLSKVILSNPT